MWNYVKFKMGVVRRKIFLIYSTNKLEKTSLYSELEKYLKKTKSTGCNFRDYWELYSQIKRRRPNQVLECGTGVSSLVIAHALKENFEETGVKGMLTSMEDVEKYFEQAKKIFPKNLLEYIEFVYSKRAEATYSIWRGVCYEKIPDKEYDFIFIDGPSTKAPSDGMSTFDIDLINVVKKSENSVYALVDKRVSSCYVYQKIFGLNKVKYDSIKHIGYIGPVSRTDLRDFPQTPSEAFADSMNPFGNSYLRLNFKKRDIDG